MTHSIPTRRSSDLSYGPSTVCAWQDAWTGMPLDDRAAMMARQGVNYTTLEGQRVFDPETMQDVPADGSTIGELALPGNTAMKGYLKNPEAPREAFPAGWLHPGHPPGPHPTGPLE